MNRILTIREEEIMQVLWKQKKAFVKEIIEQLPNPKPPLQYGLVCGTQIGKWRSGGLSRVLQYTPILSGTAKSQYRRFVLSRMVRNYFSSFPESLLSHFVKEEKMDVNQLKDLLDQLKEEE